MVEVIDVTSMPVIKINLSAETYAKENYIGFGGLHWEEETYDQITYLIYGCIKGSKQGKIQVKIKMFPGSIENQMLKSTMVQRELVRGNGNQCRCILIKEKLPFNGLSTQWMDNVLSSMH